MGRNPNGHGYIEALGNGHPLTWETGVLGDHRRVLYDKIGPGSHPCQWCGRTVEWDGPTGNGKLYVDHLDHDRANNLPENLVPSCMQCNLRRRPDETDFQPGQLKQRCKRGHAIEGDNVLIVRRDGREGRRCRQCLYDHQRRYREAKKAERLLATDTV